MKRFLLQAVQDEDHLESVREVFGVPELRAGSICTAFMTASGLSLLEDMLRPVAKRTRLFVGIRNGVTTVQSIQKALEIGCETYMVDTGGNTRIFHPKLYFALGAKKAKLLLGSANLTMGGLCYNIEASVLQTLDIEVDRDFLEELQSKLDAMITDHPQNVIRAKDVEQLIDLHRAGRLLDECRVRPSTPAGRSGNLELDSVPMMALHERRKAAPHVAPWPLAEEESLLVQPEDLVLVWISKPLKRAHIGLPNKLGTNPKGSMSLTTGRMESKIDQRHYFRAEVFQHLEWVTDEKLPHKERATVSVNLMIKGIDHGWHELRLSHDTRSETRAYKQNNYMTSLHWGTTSPLVAHEELLGHVLKLFREAGEPTRFTLEIG